MYKNSSDDKKEKEKENLKENENANETKQSENELQKQNYKGGDYYGYNIFKYTLFIELIKPSEESKFEEKQANVISHYFGRFLHLCNFNRTNRSV